MDLKFANHHGYTDVTPYEIVRVVSDKCLEVRRMKYELAPGQKPNFIPGGFAAHCTNQGDLEYVIEPDPTEGVKRIRLGKNGWWKDAHGARFIPNSKPIRYYDFNF